LQNFHTIFRDVAFARPVSGAVGDVSIAIPLSWKVISFFLVGSVFAACVFLFSTSFARIETVSGVVAPDKGVVPVLPSRNGTIVSLSVNDGSSVASGEKLVDIRAEEDSATGISVEAAIEAAVKRQDASLVAQMSAAGGAAEAQLQQLSAQRVGLVAELGQLQSQINIQIDLIKAAQKYYDSALLVAERGFISQRDMQMREESLLSRKQGLAQLEQSLATKRATLAEIERNASQISARAQVEKAGIAASRAQVEQQAASTTGSRSYVLRAPVSGRVTALTARVGQPTNPNASLMMIVPDGSVLQAELAVPSSAIGFVKAGQPVRLAIDAFPYQRFGTVKGTVLTVASTPIRSPGPNGSVISVYPVIVKIVSKGVDAFGRQEPLLPGMSLTARIVTEQQTLLEWLFEPLFAIGRR
jgi:membrane fusion protein